MYLSLSMRTSESSTNLVQKIVIFMSAYFALLCHCVVVEEVFKLFTQVKVAKPRCKNALLHVKVIHLKCYLSKTAKKLNVQ